MGQYYKTGFIDKEGNLFVLNPFHYGNGCKLLEHAYYDHDYMNIVTRILYNNPMRVCWMGDYAYQFDGSLYEQKEDLSFIESIFNKMWREDDGDSVSGIRPSEDNAKIQFGLMQRWPRYLVNYTLKRFVDLDTLDSTIDDYGEALHPLCLLTACGNGRGGGDYYGNDSRKVGSWAFDLIVFLDEVPEEFTEEICKFYID